MLEMEYVDPTLVAIPFFLATLVAEQIVLRRWRRAGRRDVRGYQTRDTWGSLGLGIGSLVTVGLLNLAVFGIATWLWQWRLVDLGTGALGWTVAIVGWDFAYYWTHRWEHEVRIFWAAHENHHSSTYFNFSTALRQPWTPFLVLVTFPPLALVGVAPWMIMVSAGLNLIYQYWVHTETIGKLPRWFEAVFNTPSHHRVHHGSNPQYLDKNYAGILIVWDRLFGTFEPEVEPVRYGLTKPFSSCNPFVIAFHEYVDIARDVGEAERFRDRVGHLVHGPAWRPEPAPEVASTR